MQCEHVDVKNTHSVTKTEISVFGRQALDAERRRSPSLADKVLRAIGVLRSGSIRVGTFGSTTSLCVFCSSPILSNCCGYCCMRSPMLLIFCGCCALLLSSQCSVTTCNASHVDIPRIAAPGTSATKNFVFLHSRPS